MRKELRDLVNGNCCRLEAAEPTLQSVFETMFSHPDFILAETDNGFSVRETTYGEVKALAEDYAAGLTAKIGATHGYVGLEMENSVEWMAAFWGILRSGNKPYLINTRHPAALSQKILRDLGITTVVCLTPGALDATYLPVDDLGGAPAVPAAFENEFALSTSATSLQETVCFYTGREVVSQLLNTRTILKESPRIAFHYHGRLKQLAFLPFYHIFGLFAVYFWFTYFGRTLVFLRDYAPQTILETCRRQEVTHLFAVPLLWHAVEKQLLRELSKQSPKKQKQFWRMQTVCTRLQNVAPYAGAALTRRLMKSVTGQLFGPSMQFCISGGSFLRPSALRLLNGLGYPLHNGYGMSEAGITSVELSKTPRNRNENAVGHPFANVRYRVGERGTLELQGDAVCKELMKNGVRQPVGEWLDTGDRFAPMDDGRWTVCGRASDLVIGENGENIDPDGIEESLTLPEATAFSVLGLGAQAEETLTLIVQVSPYLSASRLATLQARIAEANNALPSASRLRRVLVTTDAIAPATAIKVGRAWLKRAIDAGDVRLTPLADAVAAQADDALPSALAQEVRRVVAQALGVAEEAVLPDADWGTDLGMTSLQYYDVATTLADTFEITEAPDEVGHTLRQVCEWMERNL